MAAMDRADDFVIMYNSVNFAQGTIVHFPVPRNCRVIRSMWTQDATFSPAGATATLASAFGVLSEPVVLPTGAAGTTTVVEHREEDNNRFEHGDNVLIQVTVQADNHCDLVIVCRPL